MICFGCGDGFEGEGVLCGRCEARSLEREKPKKPLKVRSIIHNLIEALAVIISVIMM